MKLDSSTSLPQTAKSVPAFKEATKRSPDHAGNVLLALALAFGVGIVTMFAVWLIQLGLKLYGIRIGGGAALITGGSVTLLVLCLTGWWMIRDKLSILWTTEHIMGHEPNRDAIAGPPVKTYFSLHDGTRHIIYGDVDLDPELLIDWCNVAVHGGSLSFEAWTSRFALPDGSKGRERYTSFREWLIKQGYAKKIGGPVGLCVNWRNPDAAAFVAGFAEVTPGDGAPLLDAVAGNPKKQAARRLAHTDTLEGGDDES